MLVNDGPNNVKESGLYDSCSIEYYYVTDI